MPNVRASRCTNCKRRLDAATSVVDLGSVPSPGNISICIYCGHVMVFGKDLRLREPTGAEMVEMAGHPMLIRATMVSKLLREKREPDTSDIPEASEDWFKKAGVKKPTRRPK